MLALASSGYTPGIRSNGAPKGDMGHCNVMSNTDATCNGFNLPAIEASPTEPTGVAPAAA